MKSLRTALRDVIYLPLVPRNFKLLVRGLRSLGWLPPSQAHASGIRRILVVQPHNSLGDLVLSLPFLDQIHKQWPEAEIDLIVGSGMTRLFADIPYIRRVIAYSPSSRRPPMARYWNTLRLLLLCRNEIHDRYDLAVDPRWDSDGHAYLARAMMLLSAARVRVGYSGRVDAVDPSLDTFVTHRALGGRNEHDAIRKLKLLQRAQLSVPQAKEAEFFQVNPTLSALAALETSSVNLMLEAIGIQQGERFAILAPSASTPSKIWPIEHVAQLALRLHARHGLRFVIVGAPEDTEICALVAAMCSAAAASIGGRTNILQLLALCSRATLFIGNDSGPAHLSAMVGTPTVVAAIGRSPSEVLDDIHAPRRFRPWGPSVTLVQPDQPLPPCDPVCDFEEAHCITQVSGWAVLAACEDFLRRTGDYRDVQPDQVKRGIRVS